MNNIVIVEDRLAKGISLAAQFTELAQHCPELKMRVLAVCYFKSNREAAQREIEKSEKQNFEVVPVSLWNFNETIDDYINSSGKHATIIMDYLLDGDGSEGVPMRRVNIRYARKPERKGSGQLWFYTGTGTDNHNMLCQLVGADHVLEVTESGPDYLRLDLTEEKFLKVLQANVGMEV